MSGNPVTPYNNFSAVDAISATPLTEKKTCKACGAIKPIGLFYARKDKHGRQFRTNHCKKCENFRQNQRSYNIGRARPMAEAKDSALYLGVFIAERLLINYFNNVQQMPNGNPGYDFICERGYKIDVKSSTLHKNSGHSARWDFAIEYNRIANYFLLLAFDCRDNLNPQHIWLIPSSCASEYRHIGIINSHKALAKWSQFEKPLDKVLSACETLRGGDEVGSITA